MARLRAAVITDIHNGHDYGARLGTRAMKLMHVFAKAVGKYKPDLVIDMGDRVSSHNKDEARANMTPVRAIFNTLAAPVYHLLGNHDIKYLSRAENEEITGSPAASYSHDVNGYHMVFWNPGKGNSMEVQPEDMDWLRADIAATKLPTVVFSHVPLDLEADDLVGAGVNDIAGRFHYQQGPAIREILEQSNKVILCMSGHRHRAQYKEINGIHYIEQQSLTQEWQARYHVPHRTWAWLELDDDKISVKMHGRGRPKSYELTPK